jgi:putative endonuclease
MKKFYVYIICKKRNGTLYTGITSNLIKRIYEHKNNLIEGFSQKYNVHRLVWYEIHETAETAISREKQIKAWKRHWKLRLIEKNNPEWNDLYDIICEGTGFLPPQE